MYTASLPSLQLHLHRPCEGQLDTTEAWMYELTIWFLFIFKPLFGLLYSFLMIEDKSVKSALWIMF